ATLRLLGTVVKHLRASAKRLRPSNTEDRHYCLVLVFSLGKFEDPTGHEEHSEEDTDDENPPVDSDTEKYDSYRSAEAEWPPAPWCEAGIDSGIFSNFAVVLIVNTCLVFLIHEAQVVRDHELHSGQSKEAGNTNPFGSTSPHRIGKCYNDEKDS